MSTVEGLKPFLLLGGYNAAELWWTTNFILPTWLLMAMAPRWKHMPTLTVVSPIFHAAIYSLSIISVMLDMDLNDENAPDATSLLGVVTLFKNPNVTFAGWVHYLVFDALVGRWIVLDSIERGCSIWVHVLAIVPSLFLTLMCGPVGWLLYVGVIRTFLLPVKENAATRAKTA